MKPQETVLVQARVQRIVKEGKHGPYAVATSSDEVFGGIEVSVTFSLGSDVWTEDINPSPGDDIVTEAKNIRSKGGKWRASGYVRFLRPIDKK